MQNSHIVMIMIKGWEVKVGVVSRVEKLVVHLFSISISIHPQPMPMRVTALSTEHK